MHDSKLHEYNDENMKVIGYMACHYGKDYLRESLLSVIDLCDKFVMLYSPSPSYGFGTSSACPESEAELFAIAKDVCGDKLTWVCKSYTSEGAHRGEAHKYAHGFDLMLAVDADEVFDTAQLKTALEVAYVGAHRNYGIKGYVNLWRSFNYACFDGFLPIRVINLKNQHKDMSHLEVTIWHFSCCQSKEIMDYKYQIHGHKHELRPNWLEEKYYAWNLDNKFDKVHPTSVDIWDVVPYDKELMPQILKDHPNFNKDIV